MKFRFMERHRGIHSVETMAEMLKVSRSGYYAWRGRKESRKAKEDGRLVEEIREIQEGCRWRYGSPRVTEQLKRRGWRVGHNRVARLMRHKGLGARRRRRFRSTTDSRHRLAVAENLVKREFGVAAVDQVWVSDFSYVATAEGWLYLCVILDLCSRKVVGWAVDERLGTELALRALSMAMMRRKPRKGLILHTDRGVQYCSGAFRRATRWYGIRQSMSRKADPWDNAPMESFFKTLKSELCADKAFASREQARAAIFEYIEAFYNRRRLHSALGYLSPEEYERKTARSVA